MAMTGGTSKLVKTTYPFSDKSKAVNLYVYYKSTQDVDNNKSTVYCGMYVTTPSGWDIGSWTDFNGSYVGTTANTFNGTIPNFSGTRWLVENKSFTVDHDADGKGTATIRWKWGVNSPWGSYVNPSGLFNIDLPQIPRATTPTLSATKAQMGKKITISMQRASSSFTHTLKYTINGTTGTIKSGLDTSYEWTIPKTLVQYIPDKLQATITITCETYSGSTKVGSKTASFTATVPSASVPTLSASSVQMGESVTITINREVSYYTHTLKYTLGGTTKEIATKVGESNAWTIPDLVALIPNTTSGEATITCVTYNGTATVGTKTVKLTVKAFSASKVTFSKEPVEMGKAVTIRAETESTKYRHTLKYEFESVSGTIATGVAASKQWTVPMSLVNEIPGAIMGEVTIICETYNGTALIGKTSDILDVTVPSASVPTVTPSPAVMGEKIRVTFNKKVAAYTHAFYVTLGSETLSVPKRSGTYGEVVLPLSFAKQVPNDTKATVSVRCVTYNGVVMVGEETVTFEATVPDIEETKPTFTMAFKPVHSLDSKFKDVFVQSKSKVNVTFTAQSEYSNVKSYSIKVEGVESTGNPCTSNVIYTNGSVPIVATVTDARGYSRTITEHIPVHSYSTPRLAPYNGENDIICTRSRLDKTIALDGEYVLVRANASYSHVTVNETDLNECRVWYRYKLASSSAFNMDWTILSGDAINSVLDDIFSIKSAYTVQLWVEDDIGEERTYIYPIHDLSLPVHMGEGGKNLGLGQFCDYSKSEAIDVGWTTYFNTGIGRKIIFESDISSGWSEGVPLSTAFPNSDATGANTYNLFLAMVVNGSNIVPVLCSKSGNNIYGSLSIYNSGTVVRTFLVKLVYNEALTSFILDKAKYVDHTTNSNHSAITATKITALYALI